MAVDVFFYFLEIYPQMPSLIPPRISPVVQYRLLLEIVLDVPGAEGKGFSSNFFRNLLKIFVNGFFQEFPPEFLYHFFGIVSFRNSSRNFSRDQELLPKSLLIFLWRYLAIIFFSVMSLKIISSVFYLNSSCNFSR